MAMVVVVVDNNKALTIRDAVLEVQEALPQYKVESYVSYRNRVCREQRKRAANTAIITGSDGSVIATFTSEAPTD